MHEKMREVKKYSWHYTFNFYQQPSKAFYADTSHQYPKKEVVKVVLLEKSSIYASYIGGKVK